MSAVLEAPKPQIFEPPNFFDHRVVGADVKRWIFFAGDLIVPERKVEIDWLATGGEEIASPCLHRYGRGFVPRGRPAILEMGGEPIPMQHLGDLQATAWAGIPLNEDAVKNRFALVPVWPGDALKVIRMYAMKDGRKGIDEITALQGKSWDECHTPEGDGILDVVLRAQFGENLEIGKTLRELESQIANAKVNDSRIDYGLYKSEALRMCEDFRNWAIKRINADNALVKTPATPIVIDDVGQRGGWAYFYPPVTELLIYQLEVTRQDQPLQEMAKMVREVSANQQSQGMSAADFDALDRRFEEKLEARMAQAQAKLESENAELRRQLAEAQAKTEEVQTYTCEHCGDEMKLSVKGLHIGRHCKVLHPKTEQE